MRHKLALISVTLIMALGFVGCMRAASEVHEDRQSCIDAGGRVSEDGRYCIR